MVRTHQGAVSATGTFSRWRKSTVRILLRFCVRKPSFCGMRMLGHYSYEDLSIRERIQYILTCKCYLLERRGALLCGSYLEGVYADVSLDLGLLSCNGHG